ncbi:MAG TPA: hypothetical protein VER03_22195 [Bryobacteraceae bacterium]|nr:hypothetical protein [Bryobacteraceae bacterium]
MSTLPVGSYEVAVEALEFTRFVCKGITIRIAQVQRSILQDLTVEAAYVGNRGVWLQSDNMLHLNAVTLYRIHAAGFDRTNAADGAVLTSPWNSPAAQSRGIRAPYPSFPAGQQAIQTLRPYPQFNTITPRWTSFGNSWYDSLHVKVTKRYSHGLDLSGSFSWHKSMFIGDTRGGAVNDVYNRQQNKYLSSQDIPVMMTIAFTYVTPAATGNPIVRIP